MRLLDIHLPRRAVGAPLRCTRPTETLGCSVFLYLALLLAANERGLVLRSRTRLASDLSVREPVIDEWVNRLVGLGLISLLSPSPYLVLKLPFWSGTSSSTVKNSTGESSEAEPLKEFFQSGYSHSYGYNKTKKASRDGGVGEGNALRTEIAAVLGEVDTETVEGILSHYTPETIRKVLRRVEATPPERIRTSKLALFRFLIARLSHKRHDPTD